METADLADVVHCDIHHVHRQAPGWSLLRTLQAATDEGHDPRQLQGQA